MRVDNGDNGGEEVTGDGAPPCPAGEPSDIIELEEWGEGSCKGDAATKDGDSELEADSSEDSVLVSRLIARERLRDSLNGFPS